MSCTSAAKGTSPEAALKNDATRWLAEPGEPAVMEVQLGKAERIDRIVLGNAGSAMVEVLAGSSLWAPGKPFVPLLPVRTLMTAEDSRRVHEGPGKSVVIAECKQLASDAREQRWDRLRVRCTQPYAKAEPFGLTLFEVHSPPEAAGAAVNLGVFRPRQAPAQPQSPLANLRASGTSTADAALARRDAPAAPPAAAAPRRQLPGYLTQRANANEPVAVKPAPIDPPTKPPPTKPPPPKPPPPKVDAPKAKRPADDAPSSTAPARKKKKVGHRVPEGEIMESVRFVLSGFKNPHRDRIRRKALAMGAKYEPSWNSQCTHLVCAFPNTPKYNEVSALGGTIVRQGWIHDQDTRKVRLSAARYAFGALSDDEYSDEHSDEGDAAAPPTEPDSIAAAVARDAQAAAAQVDADYDYDAATDGEPETAPEVTERIQQLVGKLPSTLVGTRVVLDAELGEADRKQCRRLLAIMGATTEEALTHGVTHVVSRRPVAGTAPCVSPEWVEACHRSGRREDEGPYLLS